MAQLPLRSVSAGRQLNRDPLDGIVEISLRSSVLFAIGSLVIGVGIAASDSTGAQTFPELRPQGTAPRGFVYRLREGMEDFYVWYCEPENPAAGGSAPGFGIYFGLHPQRLQEGQAHEPGVVAGEPVIWTESRSSSRLNRETHLSYKHGAEFLPLTLHVFVSAQSEDQLQLFMGALKDLRFVLR